MSESNSEQRPKRRLSVRNFSVIKEAELEFGKITVLIGPQASGKSLLCKLAYFLGRVVPELAIDQVVRLGDFSEFAAAARNEFQKWFPQEGWGLYNWSIEFIAEEFQLRLCEKPTSEQRTGLEIDFSDAFRTEYLKRISETEADKQRRGFLLEPGLRSKAATGFMKLAGRGVWDAATYIPLERSLFVDMQKGYRALASDADPISSRFAIAFADSLNRDVPKPRLQRFLQGNLVQRNDGPLVSFDDGRLLPVNFLSSGSKELLPIISVLDLYEFRRRSSGGNWLSQELYGDKLYVFDELTIEEPEASVFPATQYDLVLEIASLSNETEFHPHFTITTHSPYVLSVFADLVKAGKVGATSSSNRSAVSMVIPEKYWIKESDFAAYKIENGKLESIFDKETGQIDGDYLDDVSGKISDELGQLLEIQYGKS